MKTLALRRAAMLVTVSLLVTGCIPIPVPTPASPPRFSSEQLAQITEGLATRDGVASTLGAPDLRRADDRFWIYHWTVDRGMWFAIPLSPFVGGNVTPLSSKRVILVLEFDEGGVLRSKEFAGAEKRTSDRYCTAIGVCLEHRVFTGHYTSGGFGILGFDDAGSSVTVSGSAKERVAWPAPSASECLVVLWPETQDWKRSRGMPFEVGEYRGWLPTGTFAVFDLPTGEYSLREALLAHFTDFLPLTEGTSATFRCEAGQTTYMSLGVSTTKTNRTGFQIVLQPTDPTAAQAMVANMPRVLLPEKNAQPGHTDTDQSTPWVH